MKNIIVESIKAVSETSSASYTDSSEHKLFWHDGGKEFAGYSYIEDDNGKYIFLSFVEPNYRANNIRYYIANGGPWSDKGFKNSFKTASKFYDLLSDEDKKNSRLFNTLTDAGFKHWFVEE